MKTLISFGVALLLSSCATVAPYERQYVSDSEMQMGSDASKNFNNYINTIREGAMPADATKTSGGCGCN